MRLHLLAAIGAMAMTAPAQAALLASDFEVLGYRQALERVKGDPQRHVMIYFGMSKGCPPCQYTRHQLTSSALKPLYKSGYVVSEIDVRAASGEDLRTLEKHRVAYAPVLIFLDGEGKEVLRLARGFDSTRHAVLVHEYVSRRLYRKTDITSYVRANFNAAGDERVVPQTRVAAAAKAAADDRPRLRDVLGRKHERIAGEDLRKLLAGQRMEKESQDWFLSLALQPGGAVQAAGKRKDGKGDMKGAGKWYVTKKGKLCIEVKSGGADETWCRHVFRVGDENYYYAVKDLRPERIAYRFSLEKV